MPGKSKAVSQESETVDETPAVVVEVPAPAPSGRFIVTDDNRVYDRQGKRNVDGPFRDREDAEARARKREIRG